MSRCKARARAVLTYTAPAFAVFLLSLGLAESAWAATTPAPESTTNCGGSLKRSTPTANDPNLLAYNFACSTPITAYTLIANRGSTNGTPLDDFSSGATVTDPTGAAVTTLSFNCSGSIPGSGVNCNAGAKVSLPAPDTVGGSLDTTDPYCSNIPAGSKPGTKPEPSAVIDLVVTDTTGAEDGPFRLRLNGTCPRVHVVKPKPKPKAKAKAKTKSTSATKRT